MSLIRIIHVLLVVALLQVPLARAQTGSLNPSFGTSGAQTIPGAPQGHVQLASFFVTVDGKITYYDSYLQDLVRLTASGPLDTGYGSQGSAPASGACDDAVLQGVVLGDDSTLVACKNGTSVLAAHLLPNGSYDPNFGSAGQVAVPAPFSSCCTFGLAEQAGTQRAVAVQVVGNDDQLAMVGFNAAGLDPAFPAQTIAENALPCEARLAPLYSGAFLVYGDANCVPNQATAHPAYVARLTASGSLDSSFGSSGTTTFSYTFPMCNETSTDSRPQAVRALPGDAFYVLTYTLTPDSNACGANVFLLYRFLADGAIDTSFGTNGLVSLGSFNQVDLLDLQVEADLKPLLVSCAFTNISSCGGTTSNTHVLLTRLTTAGVPDTSFGPIGVVDLTNSLGPYYPDMPGNLVLTGGGLAFLSNLVGYGGAQNYLLQILVPNFNIQPGLFSFTPVPSAAPGTTQTSNNVTVSGLDAGVFVPAYTSGGLVSVNGGAFSGMAMVQNGDALAVQLTSSSTPGSTASATLTVGGVIPNGLNPNIYLGATASATYSVTTSHASGSSGGSSSGSSSSSGSTGGSSSSGSSSSSSGGSSSGGSSGVSGSSGSSSSSSSGSGSSSSSSGEVVSSGGGSGGGGAVSGWLLLAFGSMAGVRGARRRRQDVIRCRSTMNG